MNTYLESLHTAFPIYSLLCALCAWLGTIVATRISNKENARLQERLALLNDKLEQTQKQLAGEIDKRVHVHKIQFEKEFTVYQHVMASVNRARRAFVSLHLMLKPVFDTPEESHKHYTPLRKEFGDAYSAARSIIQDNKPFYSDEVYKQCDRFIELSVDEIASLNSAPGEGVYDWKKQEEMKKIFKSIIDDIEKSIRERIQSLQVD